VRQYINASNLAVTVKMLRSTFTGAFLLLEGDCDGRLFNRFIDPNSCRTFFCYGREKLLGVVEILERDTFAGFLAVADNDSSMIFGERIASNNVIVTDENDIELVIFQSDVLERVLAEYCNSENVAAFEQAKNEPIRSTFVRVAGTLGALRCLSKLNAWHLRFEDMTLQFEQRRDIEISIDQQIEHLRGRSQGTTMPLLPQVRQEMDDFRGKFPDAHKYVSGHDLCGVICKSIHDVFGRAHVALTRKAAAVEEVFRAAFSEENFRATTVFADIKAWEVRNPPFRVLSV
jgi:hypothetical protein